MTPPGPPTVTLKVVAAKARGMVERAIKAVENMVILVVVIASVELGVLYEV